MDPLHVSRIAELASVLEVSGYPKPGNVHRTRDFDDMVYEDFLVSGIVTGDTMRLAAERGEKLRDTLDLSTLGLGELILRAVEDTRKWVSTNTNLGIIMLLTPLSAAAGMVDSGDLQGLREQVNRLILQTTSEDAVNLYRAISTAEAGGMGEHDTLDVNDPASQQRIIDENITLFDTLKMSADWDLIARELTSSMPVTFNVGFPVFKGTVEEHGMNRAVVQTFLTILSRFPDTLISRKYGEEIAAEVSEEASDIVDRGGVLTAAGLRRVEKFDRKLYRMGWNPGTTADLTASSVMVGLLDYYSELA